MAAAPSSAPYFGIREDDLRQQLQHQQQPPPPPSSSTPSSPGAAPPPPAPQTKKRRNLPGTPNPDAEVIALSPKTLMATNRFICEVCNKGFQREQNLQLHRRGHNLPWKLRQKSATEVVRQRVYLCPEPSCVHHDPSRALGDLTGIKKHFCRKHGEKKWKCDKCSKRYAVHSDLKAHSKVCGTREYRCDCGTLFSRRDSFITHRAFCDALAQESSRLPTALNAMGSHLYGGAGGSGMGLGLSPVSSQLSSLQDQTGLPAGDLIRLGGGRNAGAAAAQFDRLVPPTSSFRPPPGADAPSSSPFFLAGNQEFQDSQSHQHFLQNKPFHGLMQLADLQNGTAPSSAATAPAAANLFNLAGFFPNGGAGSGGSICNSINGHLLIDDQFSNSIAGGAGKPPAGFFLGNMMGDPMDPGVSSLYGGASVHKGEPAMLPQMSATALLQRAAQMGSSTSGGGGGITHFRSPGFGIGGGGGESMRTLMENEAHLQDLMDSLASGSAGMFGGGSGGISAFLGAGGGGGGGHEQDGAAFGGYNPMMSSLCNMDTAAKLQKSLSSAGSSMGGSDRLTRDFLGVGGAVGSMGSDNMSQQREQYHRAGAMDDMRASDMKPAAAPSNIKHFAGGSLQ